MEDANLRRDQLDGTKTSVFIGSFWYDYFCMQTQSVDRDLINSYVAMGTGMVAFANRISYIYNLKGQSTTLDTACSSSLVALHLACQSIWSGDASMAIAGGANLLIRPESSIVLTRAGFLTPDQYCKSFDASGNGYVRSEGAAIAIVKPLSDALNNHDNIYCVIRSTVSNQDGYTPEGFTVPSLNSQKVMLKEAYLKAGVNPNEVRYVEAHGPGTQVGDPIETRALGEVLCRERSTTSPLLIGSIKSNLGHLEAVSGIAGFLKACLIAKNGQVPPNLHFNTPNPNIDFKGLKLVVPTKKVKLTTTNKPLTIGVNSFGAGGANAHVVIQSYLPGPIKTTKLKNKNKPPKTKFAVLILSARSKSALKEKAKQYIELLSKGKDSLHDIAYSTLMFLSLNRLLVHVGFDVSRRVLEPGLTVGIF